MSMSEASKCLGDMVTAIVAEKEKGASTTLTFWRLSNDKILSALRMFAAGPEWSNGDDSGEGTNKEVVDSKCYNEVLDLFHQLNGAMWEQESEVWPSLTQSKANDHDLPVVFGGKYSTRPNSIAETLVQNLAASSSKVYTVSRSIVQGHCLLPNIHHIPKQKLDTEVAGPEEFEDVLQTALHARNADAGNAKTLAVYFTLGQHKGDNPFVKNIIAATNFAAALKSVSHELIINGSFRIILTGTDATKPSTYINPEVYIMGDACTVPTYKILQYNFVYAMSKLCQFCIVADAVFDILKSTLSSPSIEWGEHSRYLKEIIPKMKMCIVSYGEEGVYKKEKGGISIEELDTISKKWNDVERVLDKHMKVAQNISICFTPLHAKPWTQQAFVKCDEESGGSPRAYLLQQIVRRLKNAISIEQAARAHF